MSKISIIYILYCFILFSPSQGSAEDNPNSSEKWTLQRAVKFALENSPDSLIAKQRMEAARAVTQQAHSTWYPVIRVIAGYMQTDNPMYSFGNILNQGKFRRDLDFNNPGRTDALNIGVRVEYRLFNGGRDQAGIEAARAGEEVSGLELRAVHNQLAFQVVRAFCSIIQTRKMLQARKSAVRAVEESIKVARAKYRAGTFLETEVFNLEVQHSQALENLVKARHSYRLAQRVFLNILGLKAGEVQTELPDGNCGIEVPADLDYSNRPELLALEAAVRVAEAEYRQARGGYYPSVDAFAGYDYDRGFVTGGDGDSWIAGVKVNLDLFDGKRTSGKVAETMARLLEIRERKRKTALAINLEVEQARLALKDAIERLGVTQKMVEHAEKTTMLIRARFREGVLLSSELIDVENRLTDAKVRHAVAEAEHWVATANLRRSVGLTQFPEHPPDTTL